MSRDMASKLVEEKGSSREHRFCALIERSSDAVALFGPAILHHQGGRQGNRFRTGDALRHRKAKVEGMCGFTASWGTAPPLRFICHELRNSPKSGS
jgi:hypothetical protein